VGEDDGGESELVERRGSGWAGTETDETWNRMGEGPDRRRYPELSAAMRETRETQRARARAIWRAARRAGRCARKGMEGWRKGGR
jgi:hypothetical protein